MESIVPVGKEAVLIDCLETSTEVTATNLSPVTGLINLSPLAHESHYFNKDDPTGLKPPPKCFHDADALDPPGTGENLLR